jgi:hypothetical protein
MASKVRTMTLRLEEAEHEALLLRSQAEHTSMQLIARKAIREYLDRHQLDETTLQAHGRAIMKRYGAVMHRLAD